MSKTTKKTWKTKLHEIIYEADTPAGKLFDIILLESIFYIIYNEKNGENKYYNNISNTTDDKYHITIL